MAALGEYIRFTASIAAGMGFDVCLTDEGVEAAVFANGEKVGSMTLPGQGIPTPRSATMRFEVESCAPSYGGAYTNGVLAVVGTVIGRYWTQGLIDAGMSNELIVGFTTHWLLGLAGYSTYAEMFEGGDTYYVDPFPVPGYDLYNRPLNGAAPGLDEGTSESGAEEGMTNLRSKKPKATQNSKPHPGTVRTRQRTTRENAIVEKAERLPQDVRVNPNSPKVLDLKRPISPSVTQNKRLQKEIREAKKEGGRDFRVNQQQVDAAGKRVGVNRPDLQYTDKDGRRVYVEYDTDKSQRGAEHLRRLQANDPTGKTVQRRIN